MNLRKYAKDRECQVRIPGICNGNSETTVLAHYRMLGISGIGYKAPDLIGAWACSDCHDEIDGRTNRCERLLARMCHADGVFRTQNKLIELGLINW